MKTNTQIERELCLDLDEAKATFQLAEFLCDCERSHSNVELREAARAKLVAARKRLHEFIRGAYAEATP